MLAINTSVTKPYGSRLSALSGAIAKSKRGKDKGMLVVPNRLIEQMNAHVEKAYPEEGAGFLIGEEGEVREIIALSNSREDGSRHNRFLFRPEDYLHAE